MERIIKHFINGTRFDASDLNLLVSSINDIIDNYNALTGSNFDDDNSISSTEIKIEIEKLKRSIEKLPNYCTMLQYESMTEAEKGDKLWMIYEDDEETPDNPPSPPDNPDEPDPIIPSGNGGLLILAGTPRVTSEGLLILSEGQVSGSTLILNTDNRVLE